ncbi:MAG: terminase small subunit [Geminicoccaceae bacterium]
MPEPQTEHKLSSREHKFTLEYASGAPAKQAAINAGYKTASAHTTADRLLKRDKINNQIARHRARLELRSDVTAKEIERRLWEEANTFGPGTAHSARISALQTLAKIRGLMVERHAHLHKAVDQMGAEELQAFLGGEPSEDELKAAVTVALEAPEQANGDDPENDTRSVEKVPENTGKHPRSVEIETAPADTPE